MKNSHAFRQLLLAGLLSTSLFACRPSDPKSTATAEPQISFALESKPHGYYVGQAGLWWEQLQQNMANETAWYHYYRACRNAQGTADWREDFVEEAPFLRLGDTIVALMEEHIPNSFTYHFVKGSTGAVDPTYQENLRQAYALNPDFPGIQAAMVTYAVSTHQPTVRQEANQRWKGLGTLHPGLLQYSRNVLRTLPPNAVLLTQHDNDSYPAWMLQDAYDFRPDVLILNIDFLLLEQFRQPVFEELGIPPFQLEEISVNEYRTNWRNVVEHLLGHYPQERPLHIGLTVSPDWYAAFSDSLRLEGLSYRFMPPAEGPTKLEINRGNYETGWDLAELNTPQPKYPGEPNITRMNMHYLPAFRLLYAHYQAEGQSREAKQIAELARGIAQRLGDEALMARVEEEFGATH